MAAVTALTALSACGEQDPDLTVPERVDGQVLLDQAGVLGDDVEQALLGVAGWDVVAVAFETPQANAGEAHRAGEAVVEAWDADVVLVAVAQPGDFDSTDEGRRRFFGATPANVRAVPAGLREEIADEIVPAYAADNDWPGAFIAAVEHLREGLR